MNIEINQFSRKTLLVEIVTEELPPKILPKIARIFSEDLLSSLQNAKLTNKQTCLNSFITPRRIAATITNIVLQAVNQKIRKKILPVSIALDCNGNASPLLIKKLNAIGVQNINLSDLERVSIDKNENFFLTYDIPGSKLIDILQITLNSIIVKLLTFTKMSYQQLDGKIFHFIRPAHHLTVLHGENILPIEILGLQANCKTIGHRFLSSGFINLKNADSYSDVLRYNGKVIVSFSERRKIIQSNLINLAGNDKLVTSDALLDEVTSLVEWPVVYSCVFDKKFLKIPQECLILTMQIKQKYFALVNKNNVLQPRFLVVSNISTDTPHFIIEGNERVIHSRLADAEFSFEQDRKQSLVSYIPQLQKVIYQDKLGSQLERSKRIIAIAVNVAEQLGINSKLTFRAAQLAKADLVTDMVNEFPELQGTIGSYYAKYDGEHESVVSAIFEQYKPRFSYDSLPTSSIGQILSLADKIEALVGLWCIGFIPCKDKDPFALRRYALAICRILLELKLPLNITELFNLSYSQFDKKQFSNPSENLYVFCIDRLRSLLYRYGYTLKEINAVLAKNPKYLNNLLIIIKATRTFISSPQASKLIGINKRVFNFLRKSKISVSISKNFDIETLQLILLNEPAEQNLITILKNLTPIIKHYINNHLYLEALLQMDDICKAVTIFFDQVIINTENNLIYINRLKLLLYIHNILNIIVDLSYL